MPWGDALALDARGRATRTGSGHCDVAAAGYVVQVACIYLFAALLKDGPEWRSEYTAVDRAIRLQYWAHPAARRLSAHPTLATALTAFVFWFEALVAPLLLSPWRTAPLRALTVAGLVFMQVGFGVFLWLDTFPMIAIALVLGLLPGSLWSRFWSSTTDEAVPRAERSRWVNLVAAAALGYVLFLNVRSLSDDPTAPGVAGRPAELFGLRQSWTMFAPAPTRVDGWFVVEARGADGPATDLLTGRAVDWSQPESFRMGIRTTRELVYMRRLLARDDARRESYAQSRCRSTQPTPVALAVYFVPVIDSHREATQLVIAHACR